MLRIIFTLIIGITCSAWADPSPQDLQFYRDLSLKIRAQSTFKVPMIGSEQLFDYSLVMGSPIYSLPLINDISASSNPKKFFRSFYDRISVNDGSRIVINGEEIPLTCIFVSGQDNRYSGIMDPRFPQFIMKIYLVANDYSCIGPLNPGYPQNGGKQEMWDTYIYYEVRDPTIMLPVEAKIRYRWNEFHATFVR